MLLGGGTAIVLQLEEYRESVDIDFLCSDIEAYRTLRSAISAPNSLGTLMRTPIQYGREVRTERDKISTRALVDEIQIKVEFVLEGRIKITGAVDSEVGVPVLDRTDMYAEKLLANEDRCLDRSVMNRDAIDLAMMIHYWGPSLHEHGTRPLPRMDLMFGRFSRRRSGCLRRTATSRHVSKTCRWISR